MNKTEFDKKKSELERKQKNTNLIYASAGMLGGIAGIVYAVRTKRSFWGGVGFFFLGAIVVGVPTRLAMTARENKLEQELKNLETEYSSTSTTEKPKTV